MKNILLCFAVVVLFAGSARGAQKKGQAQVGDQGQRFVALHSTHFIAPTETLTNAEANCAIDTALGAASMRCRPAGVTQGNIHHYNASLIVDAKGTGYVVACMASLIERWCKEFGAGEVIIGNMDPAKLSIQDGDKVRSYVMLTSAFVGVPVAAQPAAAAPAAAPARPASPKSAVAAPAAAAPPRAPVAAAPAPAPNANKAAENSEKASGDSSACVSAAGACVSFVSDPLGADIYVDGKFVGNTPSALNLAPGSHEIRVEGTNRKPWTRTLEVSAGSKITIRATLDAASSGK